MSAPTAPERPVIRRGECELCGTRPARLYLAGWRCKDHPVRTWWRHLDDERVGGAA